MVGCDIEKVASAFENITPPELYSRSKLSSLDLDYEYLEDAVKHSERLSKSISGLTSHSAVMFEREAGMLVVDLNRLVYSLIRCRDDVKGKKSGQRRTGGREPAADLVCQGLITLFSELGHDVTFGHRESDPSTFFGNAVMVSFEAFNIGSDWRAFAQKWRSIARKNEDLKKNAKTEAEVGLKILGV